MPKTKEVKFLDVLKHVIESACNGNASDRQFLLYNLEHPGRCQTLLQEARRIYGFAIPEWLNDEFTKVELREKGNDPAG